MNRRAGIVIFGFTLALFSMLALHEVRKSDSVDTGSKGLLSNSLSETMTRRGPLVGLNTQDVDASIGQGAIAGLSPNKSLREALEIEANGLEATTTNSAQVGERLQAQAKTLDAQQASELRRLALDQTAPVRLKILSVYMLSAGETATQSELAKVIEAPLIQKAGETHSLAEASSMQEKSLRRMAIEGLGERAKKDSAARQLLERSIQQIEDPYVKATAEKKLNDINKL